MESFDEGLRLVGEKHLEQELRAAGHDDLADALAVIQASTANHWRKQLQWSFTDHGEKHSKRVADLALQLAGLAPIHPDLELSLIERFVLWAASWVHDLGMQNLHQNEDIAVIRPTHPERTRELLRKGSVSLGTQDPQMLEAIAIVANAHGTHYYRPVLDHEGADQNLRGDQVRIGLLAALLLMADELDLSNQRALPNDALTEFESETAAHWLKHQCVAAVHISHSEYGVQIRVDMVFPEALALDDRARVQQWIRDKLQRQIALVDPELQAGFRGMFAFDSDIQFTMRSHTMPQKYATPDVMSVIKRENARSRLINHGDALERGVEALGRHEFVALVGRGTAAENVVDGRDDLFAAVIASRSASGAVVISSAEPGQGWILSASDILESWLSQLGDSDLLTASEHEDKRRTSFLGLLLTALREGEGDRVLGLPGWERLSPQDASWFEGVLFPSLAQVDSLSVIVTTTPDRVPKGTPVEWEDIRVEETPTDDLRDWVIAHQGRGAQKWTTSWSDYASAKTATLEVESERAALS